MAFPELHRVTIEGATDPTWLMREGAQRHVSPQSPTDGRVVFDGLPAGEYTASSGRRSAKLTVPGPEVVRLGD